MILYASSQDNQRMNQQILAPLGLKPMAIKLASMEQIIPYAADQ
jgi:hypothetical protein